MARAEGTGDELAVATRPAEPAARRDDRLLKGHRFLFPILQETIPFATTHFGVRQGFALAIFPGVPLGVLGRNDLTASGLVQNFDMGVRITDWLSVVATGFGQVITGINVASIILSGASFSVNGEAGPQVRLLRSERTGTQLAASLTGGAGTGRAISVLPLLDAVAGTPGQSLSSALNGNLGRLILVPTSSATGAATVSVAQTLTPSFGLLASTQARYTSNVDSPFDVSRGATTDVASSTTVLRGAIAATADGSPSGVPVALMMEYLTSYSSTSQGSATGPSASSSGLSQFVSAGVYYSGRPELQVGVGGAVQLGLPTIAGTDEAGASAQSAAPSNYYGQFILRYVW